MTTHCLLNVKLEVGTLCDVFIQWRLTRRPRRSAVHTSKQWPKVQSNVDPGKPSITTEIRRSTTAMCSEKRVVRRFRRCANVRVCTYTSLDSTAYCTPRLYGIAYRYWATKLYSILLCWILWAIATQWCYNIILWDRRIICGPSVTETSLCGAWLYITADAV